MIERIFQICRSAVPALAGLLFALTSPRAMPQTFYVSPSGNDGNAGTSATAPFQTLGRAQAAVRAAVGAATNDISVCLSGGIYRLTNAVVFTSDDSGRNGHRVIWKAAPGETPVISGGIILTNWVLADASRNIWQASVPAGLSFRQLYVAGTRRQLARSDDNFGLTDTTNGFISSDPRVSALAGSASLATMELVARPAEWGQDILPVASIAANGTVAIQDPAWSIYRTWTNWGARSVLYLQNAYEFMAYPGDWYLRPDVNRVYYIPQSGENMTNVLAEAPVLEQLLVLAGTSNLPVSNLRFERLSFQQATWRLVGPGFGLVQGQANQPEFTPTNWTIKAALDAQWTMNLDISQCEFSHLGGDGVNVLNGSRNVVVDHCRFHDIAASAIQVDQGWGGNNFSPTSPRVNEGILVANNTIYDVCKDYPSGCGIFFGYVRNCSILNNHLYMLPYSGISFGWGWGTPVDYTSGNLIHGNVIHDYLQTLKDGGGIYCLGLQQHATLSGNYVFNASPGWGGCYYLDQGSTCWSVLGNVARHNGAAYWLFLNNSENDYAYGNYTDLDSVYATHGSYTGPLVYTNNTIVPASDWPAAALAIINKAGPDFTTYYTSDTNSLLIGRNIANGSFLQGLTGWTVGGATQLIRDGVVVGLYSDDNSPAGTNSVAFNAGNRPPGATLAAAFRQTAGHRYVLFYSQATIGAGNPQSLQTDIVESTGNVLPLGVSTTWAPGLYSRYLRVFTATASGTATLRFTDTTAVTNGLSSDSALTRVELRDVTGPSYAGPVSGDLLLQDNYNSGSVSAAGFNTTLSTDQQGSLAPLTYSVTTAGQDWQAQHGNSGTMLLAGDSGYGATASLDCNFAAIANAANSPLQIRFDGWVSDTANSDCWLSLVIGSAQNILMYDPPAKFGINPNLGGVGSVWANGASIADVSFSTNRFTVILSDTKGTGSAFNGNGSVAKIYNGTTLVGNYGLSQMGSGDGYISFGANPWNYAWNIAHVDNLVVSLIAAATLALNLTNLTVSVTGTDVTLSWPADHTGWTLLVQTNHLDRGVSADTNDWMRLPGSLATNRVVIPMFLNRPGGYYRLVYP